jgi:hypothetical protein
MTDHEQETPPRRFFDEREATDPRLTVTLGGIQLPEADDGTVSEDAEGLAEHAAIQVVSEALEQYHLEVRWIAADYENPDQ